MEKFTTHTFLVPKRDYSPEECQDSIYPLPGKSSSALFAVADGATTTFHSGRWAQELTRHFSESGDRAFKDWDGWIEQPRKDWLESARKLAEKEDANLFTKNKFAAREAASATFIGLKIEDRTAEGFAWRAVILGDSCLFHAGDGKVDPYTSLAKDPLTSDDFGYITVSACSYATPHPDMPNLFKSSTIDGGQCPPAQEGDFFILATDALSKWLILRHEKGKPVWGSLLAMTKAEEFTAFIDQIREDDLRLDDDDVALAVIRIGQPHACYRGVIYEPPVIEKPAPASGSKPEKAEGKPEKSETKTESKLEGLLSSRPASPAPEETKSEPAPAAAPASSKKKRTKTTWEQLDDLVYSVPFQRRAAFAFMALGFVGLDMVLAFYWGQQQQQTAAAPPAEEALPAMVDNTPPPAPPIPPPLIPPKDGTWVQAPKVTDPEAVPPKPSAGAEKPSPVKTPKPPPPKQDKESSDKSR